MTLKNASVLAFERKLVNSDAVMHYGNWDERNQSNAFDQPIGLQEKAVRGTISNRLKATVANDPAKLDNEIQKPNLQRVDVATLPATADTLKVSFSLRVLGDLATPSACNNPAYQAALAEIIHGYCEEHQFCELAQRYAHNLANGRFLWRNRVGAESIEIRISHMAEGKVKTQWVFDAYQLSLRDFSVGHEQITPMAAIIQQGLLTQQPTLLYIEAYVRLGFGQEIFPSQELVLDQSNSKTNKKSKFLYQVNNTAAIHSQKIGNALRTIDTWHSNVAEVGPIAVEPYGAVTNRGVAYRQPKQKQDFYSLFDNWVLKGKVPEQEQQHYVMATLIRGGVFGEGKEAK